MLNRLPLLPLLGISSFLTCNIISVCFFSFFFPVFFSGNRFSFSLRCVHFLVFLSVALKEKEAEELRLAKITVPGPMHVIFLAMSELALRLCCRVCNYYEIQKLEIKKKEKEK